MPPAIRSALSPSQIVPAAMAYFACQTSADKNAPALDEPIHDTLAGPTNDPRCGFGMSICQRPKPSFGTCPATSAHGRQHATSSDASAGSVVAITHGKHRDDMAFLFAHRRSVVAGFRLRFCDVSQWDFSSCR